MKNRIQIASALYAVYAAAVGGKAYNGDPLPTWSEFHKDEKKKTQSDAWLAVADKAMEIFKGEGKGEAVEQPGYPITPAVPDAEVEGETTKPKAPWGNAQPDPHFRPEDEPEVQPEVDEPVEVKEPVHHKEAKPADHPEKDDADS